MRLYAVLPTLMISSSIFAQIYTISTFAGGALPVDIPGTMAALGNVHSVAVDSAGNTFVTDTSLNVVLRVDAKTGRITLVAGNGMRGSSGDNGPAIKAQLSGSWDVAVDSAGNLYITDDNNNRVRKVSKGVITTLAGGGTRFGGDDGPSISAQLNQPIGVAVDSVGNVYIADYANDRIRKVSKGVITTVAGSGTKGFGGDNGPAVKAQLDYPIGVAVDSADNLYIADAGNHRIRKVSKGVITTVVGNGTAGFSGDNGPATGAQIDAGGVAVDPAGNLYIADTRNHRIRKVSEGSITTVTGNGLAGFGGDNSSPQNAQLNMPIGVAVDAAGNLYIADTGNYRIRMVSKGVITTVAGNGVVGFGGDEGPAIKAQLNEPWSVAVDSTGNLYIADTGNLRIRMVSKGVITTVAGSGSLVSATTMAPAPKLH